jgi:hypothetical protein
MVSVRKKLLFRVDNSSILRYNTSIATHSRKHKMAKPDATKWPKLAKAFNDYGFIVKWDELFDMKTDRGCYAVIAWKNKKNPNIIHMADFARAHCTDWEVQNDGFDNITLAEWKKLRIVPDCDWFEIPGKEW